MTKTTTQTAGNVYAMLHTLTKPARKRMAANYVSIPIAWLWDAQGRELERLDTIQRALRKDSAALAWLDAHTHRWQSLHGARIRYGSIQRDMLATLCNGSHDVFGSRRVAWHRFATWVALRAITSHPKHLATRASYQHIAALAMGYPTCAAAQRDGVDLTPHHSHYRRVQRSVAAFRTANMVLVWQQKGYRANWYSYLVSNREHAHAIAKQQATDKLNRQTLRKLIADTATTPLTISTTAAIGIYNEVQDFGWHDTALRAIPTGSHIMATERVGGRTYVRLSRCNATELQQQRSRLHAVIAHHVQSCGTSSGTLLADTNRKENTEVRYGVTYSKAPPDVGWLAA